MTPKNKDLQWTIGKRNNDLYCDGCQMDRPASKGGTRWASKLAPLDVREVKAETLIDFPNVPNENLIAMCTDCLIFARKNGVNVKDSEGNDWVVEGFVLDPTLLS